MDIPEVILIAYMGRLHESSKKNPSKDQAHKIALMCSFEKLPKQSQQEIDEVSLVEEHALILAPLNKTSFRVNIDKI
jgi:hypothetical protein